MQKSINNLQADINSLTNWCEANRIVANTEKTKVMTFGSPIMLKNMPKFDIMLNNVPLQRSFLNTMAALLVFKNMLLPLLKYGDVFLSATSGLNRKRLQTLQNNGLWCALNKGIETSIDELHATASLLRLKFRREQHLLNFMFDQAQNLHLLKVKPSSGIKTLKNLRRV